MTLFEKLYDLARKIGIEIDSVSIGPVRVKLSPPTGAPSDSFALLADRLGVKEKSSDVVVLSAHNVDELTAVDRIAADHECEALSNSIRSPGGSGANTGYVLARLGAMVRIAGIVGTDMDGHLLMASLANAEANTDLILSSSRGPTGRTTTLVEEGGKRLIVVFPGVNNTFAEEADFALMTQAARASKIVHLSSFAGNGELRFQERLVEAVATESMISLTPGAIYARQGLDRLERIIRHVSVVFLYREQLEQLIQNSAARSLLRGPDTQFLLEAFFAWKSKRNLSHPQVLVVKDRLQNSSGVIDQRFLAVGTGQSSLERYFSPTELPRGARLQAVDTTGAGDAAAAGFLFGMLRGLPLESCIDSAFLMASFASTQVGARTAFAAEDSGVLLLPGST